jgi:hypothetical protein
MTTLATPTPRVKAKAPRFVRVLSAVSGNLFLQITEGKEGTKAHKTSKYHVEPLACDFGRAYRWQKADEDGGDVYELNLGDSDNPASCECPGHLKWGHKTECKHLACTRVLVERCRLS